MSDEKLIAVVAAVSADGAGGTVGSATAKRIVEAVKAHEEASKQMHDFPDYDPVRSFPEYKPTNVKPNVVKSRK